MLNVGDKVTMINLYGLKENIDTTLVHTVTEVKDHYERRSSLDHVPMRETQLVKTDLEPSFHMADWYVEA